MVKRLLMWVVLLGIALPGFSQTPNITAFVDRTDISISDVFTLTIRTDAALGNTRPSLSGLNQDFEQVGGVSTRSTYTNNNGSIQSWNEISLRLRPLTTGILTIPAFRVGPEVSNPIRINVGDALQTSGNGNDEIFIESTVSKEQVYVQEQMLYTIKIFYSIAFDQGAQLTSPQVADAVVQQLGSDDNYQQVVNGIGYNVTERRFVIFPQSSGELTIPPVFFAASVGRRSGINRFFNNSTTMREINLTSESHLIKVLPRPANFPGKDWLPAAELTLEETWSGDLDNVSVGDSVTRNVTLTTQGLSSSLLPGIEYAALPGLKYYPDQPVREDVSDRNGIVGKRSEGTAIVASQAGEYVLPEVRLPWWNTVTDKLETAILPARTITVLASAGSVPNDPAQPVDFVPIPGQSGLPAGAVAAPASADLNPYLIVATLFFATAWLFSTLMWLRSKRESSYAQLMQPLQVPGEVARSKANPTAQFADAAVCLRVLQTACNNDNLYDIRKAVLQWGQSTFATRSILSPEQLAQRCHDEALGIQLAALDKALYGTEGSAFNSQALYSAVAKLHSKGVSKSDSGDRYELRPLYPN